MKHDDEKQLSWSYFWVYLLSFRPLERRVTSGSHIDFSSMSLVCLSIESFNITLKSHLQDFILLHQGFLVSPFFVSTSHFYPADEKCLKRKTRETAKKDPIGLRCLLRTNTQTVNFHEYISLLLSSPSSSKRQGREKKRRIEKQSFASKQYRKSNGVKTRNKKKTMHSLFGLSRSIHDVLSSEKQERVFYHISFVMHASLFIYSNLKGRDNDENSSIKACLLCCFMRGKNSRRSWFARTVWLLLLLLWDFKQQERYFLTLLSLYLPTSN